MVSRHIRRPSGSFPLAGAGSGIIACVGIVYFFCILHPALNAANAFDVL
jgi:hypothetical protein